MNIKVENLGAIGIIVGVAGMIWGGWQSKKMNDVAKKLNTTLTDLEGKTNVELQEDVVNTAMMNAVKRKANKIVEQTADQVHGDLKKEIKTRVGKAVEESLDSVHDAVSDKIDEMVARIDEEKFIEGMKADAKKAMAAKFNTSLDGIASEFKDQYKNLGKFVEMVVGGNSQKSNGRSRMYFGFDD